METATTVQGPYLAIHSRIQATPPENRLVLLVDPATMPIAFFRVVVSQP